MDADDDADGYNDTLEFKYDTVIWNASSHPPDMDGDLIPDDRDDDRDGDGVLNEVDAYPDDPARWEKEDLEPDDDQYKNDWTMVYLGAVIIVLVVVASVVGVWVYKKRR